MKEDFLHYIWKYRKIEMSSLRTVNNVLLEIKDTGQHNLNSGPDFFNAQIRIDGQLWAGNVEIHIKSSDWYLHNHEQNPAYDNVILHVVWEHDSDIFRNNNAIIPTLELKRYVSETTFNRYSDLLTKTHKWINCENDFYNVDSFLIENWLERLYFERLETKSNLISEFLRVSKNNWEATLFKMIAKNFGLKVNGEAFLNMANSFNFAVVRKLQSNQSDLEALFFGQAGVFNQQCHDNYFNDLRAKYNFINHKFQLPQNHFLQVQYFRLRPINFPTIRLAQLASLYSKETNLLSKIIKANSLKEFYSLIQVSASQYWDSHYSFGTESKVKKKTLSKSFMDLLLINTLIPFKFYYDKQHGNQNVHQILSLIQSIDSEKNNIIDSFNSLKKVSYSALQSQALLQLKNNYCDKNKCLQCAIGNSLLKRK